MTKTKLSKKAKEERLKKKLKDDLRFAKRTEAAWKKYEKGEFISMSFSEFKKILKKL